MAVEEPGGDRAPPPIHNTRNTRQVQEGGLLLRLQGLLRRPEGVLGRRAAGAAEAAAAAAAVTPIGAAAAARREERKKASDQMGHGSIKVGP